MKKCFSLRLQPTVTLALLGTVAVVCAQQPATPAAPLPPPPVPPPVQVVPETAVSAAASSTEQGQTSLSDSFDSDFREGRLEKRGKAIEDTQFKVNFRTMYFDRNKYDGSESEAWAAGGWAGFKTGYFLDHVAFGLTGYTSQNLIGDKDKDGTLMLEPGQEGYSVLGELNADIRIMDGLNLYAGRMEINTPFVNGFDVRMTPKTFEAYMLMGQVKLGSGGGGEPVTSGKTILGDGKTPAPAAAPAPAKGPTLKYGLGYIDRIKEWNSVDFVSMSKDAGAEVDRGVFTAGALYQNGGFSIGGIDYYSDDIINIAYFEAKQEFELNNGWKPRVALQFTDQRSVGDELLQGNFSVQQYGIKAELPVGPALFTVAYSGASGDANMQHPWSSDPGYTSVQVEDFNRDGEEALLLRAGYDFPQVKGLSTYALWVHGTDPDAADQYARDEYNLNLQWAPPEGTLKGLSLRLRYSLDKQHGGNSDDQTDFRVICNYAINF